MKKVCVFCGEAPAGKTKEHVIPMWLIEQTGSPKRKINLGYDWRNTATNGSRLRSFAFDQFVFPACSSCNEEFSELESQAKKIVGNLLKKYTISEPEAETFLNWLDKIRVGLWLGHRQLDGDIWKVRPNFHIKQRMAQADRMVAVYSTEQAIGRGINFLGMTPLFQHFPTCFSLRVNHLWFLNISTPGLLLKRLGFPFPDSLLSTQGGGVYAVMRPGKERIVTPIVQGLALKPDFMLLQPIWSKELNPSFQSNYVHRHSRDHSEGIGKVFLVSNTQADTLDATRVAINRRKALPADSSYTLVHQQTLRLQNRLIEYQSFSLLTSEEQCLAKMKRKKLKELNRFLLEQTL